MNRPILKLNIAPRDLRPKRIHRDATPADRRRWLKQDMHAFKAAFPDAKRPYAIGVGKEVRKTLGISISRCERLMRRLTRHPKYLKALARDGAMRHTLDGTPAEPVSDEHRAQARKRRP